MQPGTVFQFNAQSIKRFGGVVLTHVDEYDTPFCYDDYLEQIRVTNLYGVGEKYTRINGTDDFLFSKMGWENENSKLIDETSCCTTTKKPKVVDMGYCCVGLFQRPITY